MKLDALNQQGLQHKNNGQLDAAERCFRAALEIQPDYPSALGNLAVVLRQAGRPGDALPLLERLVQRLPELAQAHYSLGNVYSDLARFDDAIAAFRKATELDPRSAESWVNLGNAFLGAGQRSEALQCFRQAVALQPDLFAAQYSLARVASIESLIVEGLTAAERALAINPDHAPAVSVYASLLKDIGLGDQAVAQYRRAIALNPANRGYFDALLPTPTFQGANPDRWFAQHLRYGRECEAVATLPAVVPASLTAARRAGTKLRIGYVSADFRAHSIAYFTWPLFKAHDRSGFELTGYFTGDAPDRETGLFAETFDRWRDVHALGDDALAAQIRDDRIDILVDLSSHTAGSRLGVFARRPAPVQVTWLGYAATTGLTRIDWRITDAIIDPPGTTEAFHTERLFRLPGCSYCFSPSPGCPDAGPLPARQNGRLTLGSFSNSAKLTPPTIALWSRVLAALPDANLRVFIYGGDDAPIAEHVRRQFAAHGIDPARIEPFGKRPFFDFMRLHQTVDLALDPLSFSGVTTTLYTLWMGVPLVTLPGRLPSTRGSASLLDALGMDEFVASDEADYIAIVCRAAAELDRLACWRAELRERIQASPLLDHAGFARRLETAYREMWQRFLDQEH